MAAVILEIVAISLCISSICGFVVSRQQTSTIGSALRGVTHSEAVVRTTPVKNLYDGMKIRRLPHSNLEVSEVCLGTLNFGDQLDEAQSTAILDSAFGEYGINFLDTSEFSPLPYTESSAGAAEKIVGRWLKTKKRSDVIISGKICGYSNDIRWLRSDRQQGTRATRDQIIEAVNGHLQRLGCDYIDLLQIQWPDRYLPISGSETYNFKLERNDSVPIFDQIKVMDELIKAGKIRHYGVSNETPYGIALWTATADIHGLPRPVSTQNAYNFLVRNDFEIGMVEACSPSLGNVGLLAYSPLAGGALTGKYLDNKLNPNSRLHKYIGFMHRYISPPCQAAVKEYQEVAKYFSLPLSAIALSFVYSRPFVSSTIIGVTSLSQLHDNVLSLNVPYADEIHSAINNVYRRHLDPTKGVFELNDPFIENIDPSKEPWGAKDFEMDPELDLLLSQRMSKFFG